jgi:hypothetical protein
MSGTVVIVNPRSDAGFVAAVDRGVLAAEASPIRLEALLRATYPNAVVRGRTDGDGEEDVWYVFRDGELVSGGVVGLPAGAAGERAAAPLEDAGGPYS